MFFSTPHDFCEIACSSSGFRFPAPGISRSMTYLGIYLLQFESIEIVYASKLFGKLRIKFHHRTSPLISTDNTDQESRKTKSKPLKHRGTEEPEVFLSNSGNYPSWSS